MTISPKKIFITLFFIGVVGLHYTGVLLSGEEFFEQGLSWILRPSRAVGANAPIALFSHDPLVSDLRMRIASLEARTARCSDVEEQNASLKTLLGYREQSKRELIPAAVLGMSTDPQRSMLTIDRGSADGVQKGGAAIAGDGVFVGKVVAVHTHSSTVMLLNDNRSKVVALFSNEDRPRGIIEGQFQLGLKMSLIPIAEKIEKDSLVATSGTEPGIPAGLLIGRVADIQSKPTDLFQSARIIPSIPYDSLIILSILKIQSE